MNVYYFKDITQGMDFEYAQIRAIINFSNI